MTQKLEKIIGVKWQIIFGDERYRNSLVVAGMRTEKGSMPAIISSKEDYEAFQKALKEFAQKLGWE